MDISVLKKEGTILAIFRPVVCQKHFITAQVLVSWALKWKWFTKFTK